MKKEYCLTLCRWDDGGIHAARGPVDAYISEGSEVLIGTEDGEIHAVVEWARDIVPNGYFDEKLEKLVLLMSYAPDVERLDKISAVIYRSDCKYEEDEDDTEGNCVEASEEA